MSIINISKIIKSNIKRKCRINESLIVAFLISGILGGSSQALAARPVNEEKVEISKEEYELFQALLASASSKERTDSTTKIHILREVKHREEEPLKESRKGSSLSGLSNQSWDSSEIVASRAATEGQLRDLEQRQLEWNQGIEEQIAADLSVEVGSNLLKKIDSKKGSVELSLNPNLQGLETASFQYGIKTSGISMGRQKLKGRTGDYIVGLSNTAWTGNNIVKSRAATEGQLKTAIESAKTYLHVNTGLSTQRSGSSTTNFGGIGEKGGALGLHSLAAGVDAIAEGRRSSAVGQQNQAKGAYSTAFGTGNITNGEAGLAFGYHNVTEGLKSAAVGSENKALAERTLAFGHTNIIRAKNSIAFGFHNEVSGSEAAAYGFGNVSEGTESLAFGAGLYNKEKNSWMYNRASGKRSAAFGIANLASGYFSNAIGVENKSEGKASSAIGNQNIATAERSAAIGDNNSAYGIASSAYGNKNKVLTDFGSAFGSENIVDGINANAIGSDNLSIGKGSTALGVSNTVSQKYSNAFGFQNKAIGERSSAVGTENQAIGKNSNAYGDSNSAVSCAAAYGRKNMALAEDAIAFGLENKALGGNSMAFGTENLVTQRDSVVLGNDLSVTGQYSTAIGNGDRTEIYRKSSLSPSGFQAQKEHLYTLEGEHSLMIGQANRIGKDSRHTQVLGSKLKIGEGVHNSGAIGTASVTRHYEKGKDGQDYLVAVTHDYEISGDESYAIGNRNNIAKGADKNFILGNDVDIQENIQNSVALGNESSLEHSNVISIGSEGKERRIQHLKEGQEATDAVNLGQLEASSLVLNRTIEHNKEEQSLWNAGQMKKNDELELSILTQQEMQSAWNAKQVDKNDELDKTILSNKEFQDTKNVELEGTIAGNKADIESKLVIAETSLNDTIDSNKIDIESKLDTAKVELDSNIEANAKLIATNKIAQDQWNDVQLDKNTELESVIVSNKDSQDAKNVELEGTIASNKTDIEAKLAIAETSLNDTIDSNKVDIEDKLDTAKVELNSNIKANAKLISDNKFSQDTWNDIQLDKNTELESTIASNKDSQDSWNMKQEGINDSLSSTISLTESKLLATMNIHKKVQENWNEAQVAVNDQFETKLSDFEKEIPAYKKKAEVLGGSNISVVGDGEAGNPYKLNVEASGLVVEGDAGLVSGDTLYKELQAENGKYILSQNSLAGNLKVLDLNIYLNKQDIQKNAATVATALQKLTSKDGSILLSRKGNTIDLSLLGNTGTSSSVYVHVNDGSGQQLLGNGVTNKGGLEELCGATGRYSVTLGKNTSASGQAATSLGYRNLASGSSSMAIGTQNRVSGVSSIALGRGNNVMGISSAVLGNSNDILGQGNIVLGHSNKIANTAKDNLILGSKVSIKKGIQNSIALGNGSTVDASNVLSIGSKNKGRRISYLARGVQSSDAVNVQQLLETNSGYLHVNTGDAFQERGDFEKNFGVIGAKGGALGRYSMALGVETVVKGEESVAIGYGNTISSGSTKNFLLGNNIHVADGIHNSIALGNASTLSSSNVVSIGSQGKERRIMHVAAGIKATDAVNMAQLESLKASLFARRRSFTRTNVRTLDENPSSASQDIFLEAEGKLELSSAGGARLSLGTEDENIRVHGGKVTDLADGEISETSKDAINGSQVYTIQENVSSLQTGLEEQGQAIQNLDQKVNTTGSLSAALAGLHPMAYDETRPNQVMAAMGSYKGSQAVAVGVTHYFNDAVMLNAGLSANTKTGKEVMGNLGFTWKLGDEADNRGSLSMNAKSFQQMQASLSAMAKEHQKDVKEKVQLVHKIEKQDEIISKLLERLEKIEKRLDK